MKKFLKDLFGALHIILAPVAMAGWQMVEGVKWWVAGLAGLGVMMLVAFACVFISSVAATIKGIREEKKTEEEKS